MQPIVSAGPPEWDLEIDANDQPHVALYVWPAQSGRHELEYGWCSEVNCLELSAWHFVGVLESDGRDPDLELSAEGQPRLAYIANEFVDTSSDYSTLFYGWCDVNCQSSEGVWTHSRVENGRNIIAEWQGGYPAAVCEGGFAGGGVPSLALDGADAPRIAYDTHYYGPCEYDVDTGSWKAAQVTSLVWQSVRAVIFPQP